MWTLTDDSSCQYVRKIEGVDGEFDLIEMCLINPDTNEREVYTDTICAEEDVDKDELITLLNGFGYSDPDDVRKQYGDEAEQVMAECVFEYYGNSTAKILFRGSEDRCVKFIEDYVGR